MERVIYEIKGMPKKMKRFFSLMMCIIYALGAGVLIVAFTAKEYTGLGGGISQKTPCIYRTLGELVVDRGQFCM